MKKRLLLILSFSSFMFAQDYEQAVKKHNELFAQYAMANDVDDQVSLYTEDALSLPSYMPMLQGHEQIREAVEDGTEIGVRFTDFVLTSERILDAGDYIIDIGTFYLQVEMDSTYDSWEDFGKYITIFKKMVDGSLKIYVDTWNSDINPWEEIDENEVNDEQGEN